MRPDELAELLERFPPEHFHGLLAAQLTRADKRERERAESAERYASARRDHRRRPVPQPPATFDRYDAL